MAAKRQVALPEPLRASQHATRKMSPAPCCPRAPQVPRPDRPMAAGPSSGVAHTRHPRPSPPAPSLIRSVEYFSTYVKATTDGGGSRCQGDAPKNSPTPPTFPSAAVGTEGGRGMEGWRDGGMEGWHEGWIKAWMKGGRVIEMDRGIFGGINGEVNGDRRRERWLKRWREEWI